MGVVPAVGQEAELPVEEDHGVLAVGQSRVVHVSDEAHSQPASRKYSALVAPRVPAEKLSMKRTVCLSVREVNTGELIVVQKGVFTKWYRCSSGRYQHNLTSRGCVLSDKGSGQRDMRIQFFGRWVGVKVKLLSLSRRIRDLDGSHDAPSGK